MKSDIEIAALTDRFKSLTEEEQRLAIRCFDTRVIYEELCFKALENETKIAQIRSI